MIRRAFLRAATASLSVLVCGTLAFAQATPLPPLPPGGTPLLASGVRSLTLSGSKVGDGKAEVIAVTGQPFNEAVRVRTSKKPPEPYNIQMVAPFPLAVQADDALLATFWLRTVQADDESGEAKVGFVVEEALGRGEKYIEFGLGVGPEWKRFTIPVRAFKDNPAGGLRLIFRVGYTPQTVEIGGLTLVNYGKAARVSDLPQPDISYAGREPNAPWRVAARTRIEKFRKGDLTVRVVRAGKPVPGALVTIAMKKHAYGFGSAVNSGYMWRGKEDDPDKVRYRALFARTFNRAADEGSMKWPAFNKPVFRQEVLRTSDWLKERNIDFRGHTLVWPSWKNTPPALKTGYDAVVAKDGADAGKAYLRTQIAAHIADAAGVTRGRLIEWDVVNEPFQNHDLMDALGGGQGEAMAEWFTTTRQTDPASRLFLNEALNMGGTAKHDYLYTTTQDLIARNAPLDGIGFQCHYGWNLYGPEKILANLDRFAKLGKAIEVTEFDVNNTDEKLQADYTRDFLTAVFSHPSTNAVVLWGFWEGRHWRPDAALWRRDWTLKPNGQAWLELTQKQWWTNATGQTAPKTGAPFRTRGFLGDYAITVTSGGVVETVAARLEKTGTVVTVVLP